MPPRYSAFLVASDLQGIAFFDLRHFGDQDLLLACSHIFGERPTGRSFGGWCHAITRLASSGKSLRESHGDGNLLNCNLLFAKKNFISNLVRHNLRALIQNPWLIHDISMTILCKKRNKATLRTLRACKSSMPVTTSCVSPMRACFINLLDAALVIFCFTRALAYDLQALGRQRMLMFSTCFHPREKLRLASPTLKIWLRFSNLGTARLRGWGSYQSWLFWRGGQPCYSDTLYSTPQFQWIVIIQRAKPIEHISLSPLVHRRRRRALHQE